MPAPSNQTPGTAVVISSLPYSTTQNVRDGGVNYTVFYTYTTSATDEVLSLWGFGDVTVGGYAPTTAVLSDVGGTVYRTINSRPQTPVYFTVSPNTQYWFRFTKNNNTANPAVLTVELRTFTQATAPEGSLFINDASSASFPAALLSATDGAPVEYVNNFPGGEQMVQLLDGTLLVEDIDTSSFKIYTGQYVYVATLSGVYSNVHISSNRTTRFYAGNSSNDMVTAYSTGGAAVASYGPLAADVQRIGIARDDSLIYYAAGTSGAAIKRWTTATNSAASDLVAGVAGYTTREIFVLEDGTVLVLRRQVADTTVFTLIHYSAAGATLHDYSSLLTDSDTPDAHLAFANDDPDSFWVWFKIANGFSRWVNVDTAAGTAITPTPLEQIHYTSGSYDGDDTATPDSYFGASESCTFVITRMASVPPASYTTETWIPRRQRRAPHLSREQLWNFYSQFQLDLEAGVGLTTGQGSDPQIMLRWSDDGGHTWSDEHWVSAGDRGHYKHRAIWRRLGRSRDRVFEVTVSDPVAWNLLQAFLQVEPGTS